MNSNSEIGEKSKKFKIEISQNPFVRDFNFWDEEHELFDKIKTAILTVLLVPVRIICIVLLLLIAWSLAYIGLYGCTKEELKTKPISGWRGKLKKVVGWLFRGMFFVGTAHFVTIKGKRASPKEAPVLIGAPHTSFFDTLSVLISGPGSVVGKVEAGEIPFYGTRHMKSIIRQIACSMWMLCGFGIMVRGKRANRAEAPILVCAPHTTFFDAMVVYIGQIASPLVRVEEKRFGKLIDMAQPIYVNRENHNSRVSTIQDILARVQSPEDWPQIMIFPEGTCTNRTSLIQFKTGAFNPGVSIQPVCIRYPNKVDTFTWTWGGPDVLLLVWRTLAQFHTFVEVEYLPVYVPNEEEKKNPKLYAQNVQRVMSKALNIPVSDYTFDDCKLMESASRCKLMFAKSIADMSRLREKIGLAQSQIEEYIVKENFNGNDDYYFKFEEFVQRLKIAADNVSFTLFKLFVSKSDIDDVIDFKEYLLHALFLCKQTEPKIELVKMMFLLYGEGGRVQREQFVNIINHFLKLKKEDLNNFFYKMDTKNIGSITLSDFKEATYEKDERFNMLYTPNRNFRQKQNSQ